MKPHRIIRGIKSLFPILFVTFTIFTLLVPGCNQALQQPQPSQSPPESTPAKPPPPSEQTPSKPKKGTSPAAPLTIDVSFPNGAPALNQIAVLKVVATHKTRVMNDVRIDLILPEGFELISGDPTWSATDFPYGEIEVINIQVKAIRTGNWIIEARLNERNNASYPEGGARYPIYVSVREDTAEWRINPPYGNPPTDPVIKDGELIRPVQPPTSNTTGTPTEELPPPPEIPVNPTNTS